MGASILSTISGLNDEGIFNNSYVKKDKNLLSDVRDLVKLGFKASREQQNSLFYKEVYDKIVSMSEYQAKSWFENVTIKEELLENIKSSCNLSEEMYNVLLEKVGFVNEEEKTRGGR